MEKIQKISENIIRLTASPTDMISDASMFIAPELMHGEEISERPAMLCEVSFSPRDIYHSRPDGEPVIRVIKTVDGQRTYIDNLVDMFDRTAWRARIGFAFGEDEHIFGFGQDEDGVWDKRGKMTYLYQHNMRAPIPMFVSSRGYAVLFNCTCLMTMDDTGESCVVTLECVEQADLFVLYGSMDEIIAAYRTLTGRAAEMPEWILGYWQSKERYATQQELVDTVQRYRELGIGLDVIVQDWKTWSGEEWGDKHVDRERYPDLNAATSQIHDLGAHALVSVWPNMNAGCRDHAEFVARGKLLNDYSTYDAFDPEARALYWEQAERELFRGGFDGWWCDSTEPFAAPDWGGEVKLPEAERYARVGGEHERYLDPSVANAYALAHAQGIFENQSHGPVVNLTRSGWAGIQKYGVILWAGDTSATWDELRREITKGLSISLSGIPWWTVDAGAFFAGGTPCWRKWKGDPEAAPVWFWHGGYDKGIGDLGYQELYTRWLQFACFLPVFRSHGTDTPREIWNFDEPFRSAIRDTIALRYRLMPYIRDMAHRVSEEHFTVMRAMSFDFPDDPMAWKVDDAFMFGTQILVCPVTEPILYGSGSTPLGSEAPAMKRCYLPQGTEWIDFWTGEEFAGGQTVEVPVELGHIPVFVREGAEIPMQEGLQCTADNAPVVLKRFSAQS